MATEARPSRGDAHVWNTRLESLTEIVTRSSKVERSCSLPKISHASIANSGGVGCLEILVVWSDHIGIVSKAGADPVIISSLGALATATRT
jgi:hypothetical protein